MFELISEMFNYAFMRRAFVVTTILSASVAPVGAFLVLRRLSLAGEAMAHAITPGVVIGFVFGVDQWKGLAQLNHILITLHPVVKK